MDKRILHIAPLIIDRLQAFAPRDVAASGSDGGNFGVSFIEALPQRGNKCDAVISERAGNTYLNSSKHSFAARF